METDETKRSIFGCERVLALQWSVQLALWVDLAGGEEPAALLKLSTLFLF